MRAYPKAPDASNAHQLLEKYKLESGGGVGDDATP